MNDEVQAKLVTLHPEEEAGKFLLSSNRGPKVTKPFVRATIRSTKKETAPGPSGLDGQFVQAIKYNEAFVDFMTKLSSRIAAGDQELRQVLLASRIIPLEKNSRGDVRPIAVGGILYRIAAKILVRAGSIQLLSNQFGVQSANGVEPVVHLAGLWGSSKTILSFDLKNAFNSMKRSFINEAIVSRSPQLTNAFRWAYSGHTPLYLSDGRKIFSKSGVRQGDPFGPAFFSIGFSQILQKLQERFEHNGIQEEVPMVAYLDDLFVFVRPSMRKRAVRLVEGVLEEYQPFSGLLLRKEKTRISKPKHFRRDGFDLLGSHVGPKSYQFLQNKLEQELKGFSKLQELRSQDSFLLLRSVFIPKLMHLQRTLEISNEEWKSADQLILKTLTKILGRIRGLVLERKLISLPLRLGGLGLTLPSFVAQAALASSKAESFAFLARSFPHLVLPTQEDTRSQKERMLPKWREHQHTILGRLSKLQQCAFADNCGEAGSKFLQALPLDQSLTLGDGEFTGAIAERLLHQPGFCEACQTYVEYGHVYSCTKVKSLITYRHEGVKKAVADCFRECGSTVEVEVTCRDRRTDVVVTGDVTEGSVAIDVSVVAFIGRAETSREEAARQDNIFVQKTFRKTLTKIQTWLQRRFQKKMKENEGYNYGGIFKPFIISGGGTFLKSTLELIARTKRTHPRQYRQLVFQLSCVLARFRGRAVLKCFT